MIEESWINLMMKMKDMPHYRYKPAKSEKGKRTTRDKDNDDNAREGTIEDLQKKFAKYIKK
jgi:hypothetical protein